MHLQVAAASASLAQRPPGALVSFAAGACSRRQDNLLRPRRDEDLDLPGCKLVPGTTVKASVAHGPVGDYHTTLPDHGARGAPRG